MTIEKLTATAAAALFLTACSAEKPAEPKSESKDAHAAAPAAASNASSAASAPATTTAPKGSYEVKSGIIEMKSSMMGDGKTVIYFDDYGAKQATYSTVVMKMMGQEIKSETVVIDADGWHYEFDLEKKTGTKRKSYGPASIGGAAPPPDVSKMDAKKLAEMEFQELPAKTIAGKEAKGYAMKAMGMKIKSWSWKGLPLYTEMDMGGKSPMTMEATKVDVDVPVPSEKFQVPQDVTITGS